MKKVGLGTVVALVALSIGIVSVWFGAGVTTPEPFAVPPLPTSTGITVPAVPAFASDRSGEVQLRFKGFRQFKDLVAEFELMNDTDQPIVYLTYTNGDYKDKNNFCSLAARQGEKVSKDYIYDCRYSQTLALQTLASGDSASFFVAKWEVKTLLKLEASQPEIMARLGFEIFKGVDQRSEIVWGDEIAFPKTLD